MPTRFDLTFEVGSYGRSASDDGWEEIEPQHIDVWKSAVDLLGRRTLRLPNGVINVVADWRPILRKHERHYATMKRFYAELSNDEAEFLSISKGFPTRKAKIPISVEVNGGNRLGKQHPNHLTAAAASSYLHDVFLILNLCAPGCCDFYRGTLVTTDAKTDVSLSNIDFEFALLGSFEKNWPSIKRLPLDRTVRWFDAVRPNAHQIPQNAMEKVLFALLHLATLDVDPMRVIWLFYALESLLETKAGENFSAL
ncbi:MAG: hypothetical protein GY844_07525, partial [Bradyrhizobium sp.]|nr:hypothetical protein [Bradyrhizobium sp.]